MNNGETAEPLTKRVHLDIAVPIALGLFWWTDGRGEAHRGDWLRLSLGGLSFLAGATACLALLWLCRRLWGRRQRKGAA